MRLMRLGQSCREATGAKQPDPSRLNSTETQLVVVVDSEKRLKSSDRAKLVSCCPVLRTTSSAVAANPAAATTIGSNVVMPENALLVTTLPQAKLQAVALFRNEADSPSPEFKLRFYAGDPQKGGRPISVNGVGPIQPATTWGEASLEFALKEGEDRVFVIIDPDNALKRPEESKELIRSIPASFAAGTADPLAR